MNDCFFFIIIGIVYRQCMANGEWSETDSVQCILAELEVINSQVCYKHSLICCSDSRSFVSKSSRILKIDHFMGY